MQPRASVLLPVRNALPYLAEALASTLADPAGDIEVIAIDDGSTDGSGAVLAETARADARLRVLHTQPQGIAAALNLGLERARAGIVVRMDADDRSLPGRIGALAGLLERRPDLALAGTGVALHPEGGALPGMRRYVAWLNEVSEESVKREIWIESPLAHPTLAFRRSVVIGAGGYRAGAFPEDYDLLLRLHLAGAGMGKVDDVLYWWRDHGRRLTRSDPRYAPEGFRQLKARALRAGPLASAERVVVWGAGKTGRPLARALRAEGFAVQAWIDVDPRQIGRTLHGAPVLGIGDLGRVRGMPVVVAVGADGARPLIRAACASAGLVELRDYWVLA